MLGKLFIAVALCVAPAVLANNSTNATTNATAHDDAVFNGLLTFGDGSTGFWAWSMGANYAPEDVAVDGGFEVQASNDTVYPCNGFAVTVTDITCEQLPVPTNATSRCASCPGYTEDSLDFLTMTCEVVGGRGTMACRDDDQVAGCQCCEIGTTFTCSDTPDAYTFRASDLVWMAGSPTSATTTTTTTTTTTAAPDNSATGVAASAVFSLGCIALSAFWSRL